jgi:CobQ-like glutamine amidotransferase family enzyme
VVELFSAATQLQCDRYRVRTMGGGSDCAQLMVEEEKLRVEDLDMKLSIKSQELDHLARVVQEQDYRLRSQP